MKRTFLRISAVLLGIVVLSAAFTPLTAFADELSVTDTVTLIETETETETKEMTVLREEFVKHFELPDGTGAAVVYDSPVHYEKDGEWVEIDNALVAATKIGDSVSSAIVRNDSLTAVASTLETAALGTTSAAYYENNDNPFKVQLPAAMHKNAPIAVSHGEHTLRFCFDGAADTVLGAVEQPFTKAEQTAQLRQKLSAAATDTAKAEVDKEHAMTAWKNRSAVTFAAVQPNVDLQYHVSGKKLKETLIFNEVPAALSFSFTFTYTGLQAVLQQDNSVHFVDDAGAVVFVVEAPYMFDNGEGYSTDIAVTVQPTATGCRYTLTPDRAWLTDEERVYPVTLDPTVNSEKITSYMADAGVQQSNPDTNYNGLDRIYVGSGPNSTRGCMYFDLLQWPDEEDLPFTEITSAYLYLNYYPTADWQTGHDFYIDIYRLRSAWGPATITWNNSTNIYGTDIGDFEIKEARRKVEGQDKYNITQWVQGHYAEPSTDFGIRLQPRGVSSTLNRVCYISSEYTTASLRPLVEINYRYRYRLTLKHFFDGGFVERYGSVANAVTMIQNYTGVIHDYFLETYQIKISHTISPYTSSADTCTEETHINFPCGETLTGVCDYESGIYHCTNLSNMMEEIPEGYTEANFNESVKMVKWTGYTLCSNCPIGGTSKANAWGLGILSGYNILICLGYIENDFTSTEEYLEYIDLYLTSTLAHELGHTLGCHGDVDYREASTCVQYASCIMQYGVSDRDMVSNLLNINPNAYCGNCDSVISAYATQYLLNTEV